MKSNFIEVSCETFVKFVAAGKYTSADVRNSFVDDGGSLVARISLVGGDFSYLVRKEFFDE